MFVRLGKIHLRLSLFLPSSTRCLSTPRVSNTSIPMGSNRTIHTAQVSEGDLFIVSKCTVRYRVSDAYARNFGEKRQCTVELEIFYHLASNFSRDISMKIYRQIWNRINKLHACTLYHLNTRFN